MRRRVFIKGIAGSVAWPLTARAQQPQRMRRIGVLQILSDDSEGRARLAAFVDGLKRLGWVDGENVHIDRRSGDNQEELRRSARELVALAPDAILAESSAAIEVLLQATRTIPIVFTVVADPVGAGYVANLAHPGGNATGFINFEYAIAGKWLELLKEIAPKVTQVAVLRDPAIAAGPAQFATIQAVAPSLGVELRPMSVHDVTEIENSITEFAKVPNGGLIITGSPKARHYRDQIIGLAAQYKLPAVYNVRFFAVAGGLMSYGSNVLDQFPRAAQYIDRILRGEKPADLPVQAPTKYETVVNLKTAKALGLAIPQSILATAEVIE